MDRVYPEGSVAWDEAWRQRQRADQYESTLQWIYRNIERVKDFTFYTSDSKYQSHSFEKSINDTVDMVRARIAATGVIPDADQRLEDGDEYEE